MLPVPATELEYAKKYTKPAWDEDPDDDDNPFAMPGWI